MYAATTFACQQVVASTLTSEDYTSAATGREPSDRLQGVNGAGQRRDTACLWCEYRTAGKCSEMREDCLLFLAG